MGQVAFDTQEFVETLENAGLPKEQARAISIAVKKSHEVADVATKADIVELRNELNHKIDDVNNELSHKIEDVRKDLSSEIEGVRKDMENRFDKLGLQLTVRLGGMLIVAVGALAAIIKTI